jgi:hypothetical protein
MRHLVCFNFLPKRRISCPKGPRSHGFCGRTVAQAALNYVARSCLKSEVQQSFIPLSLHSWLRHIGAAYGGQRLQAPPVLRGAGHEDLCQGESGHSNGLSQGRRSGQGRREDHRSADLSTAVRAEHRAGPVDLSALSGRDGGMAHLAPDLWSDLRRGSGDQTRHVCINRATSRSLMKGWMCQKSARRALCASGGSMPAASGGMGGSAEMQPLIRIVERRDRASTCRCLRL